MKFILFFLIAAVSLNSEAKNTRISSFNSSKKILKKFDIFNQETLYCGCKINGNKVSFKECGYESPNPKSKRSGSVEWEHIVTADNLSQGVAYNKSLCGKLSKRRCLEKLVPDYRYRTADLYNLVPEDGYLNLLRSNKPMEEVLSSDRSFGKCGAKISKRGFTPRNEAKGFVARVHLYMDKAYPSANVISNKNRKLHEAWNKMYPVTSYECQRAKKIESLQGNENEFVKKPCLEKGLW